jgi:YesN/AraC family two-component response regulator
VVSKFEKFLNEHCSSSHELSTESIPTIKQCGERLYMSGAYLSDLLKVETEKSALNHIQTHLIEKGKNALLGSDATIGEIFYL